MPYWKNHDAMVQGQQNAGIEMVWKLSSNEFWDILKDEIHSEPTNKPLTTVISSCFVTCGFGYTQTKDRNCF